MESEAQVPPLSRGPPTAEELLEAAKEEDKSLLNVLLDRFNNGLTALLLDPPNAGINIRTDGGLTALHLAVREGNIEAVEALLDRGADIEVLSPGLETPLYFAMKSENAQLVECLLRHGAAPNAETLGLMPLQMAAIVGDEEMARLLLDYGADASITAPGTREPLFLAVGYSKANVLKLLLDRGADPNSFSSEDPPTVLHLAAQAGNIEAVQILLNEGAKVDPRDFEGATPLFRAVDGGHLEVIKMLLQRGANTRTWRSDGVSVLDLAEGNKKILELLQEETVWQGPRVRNTGTGDQAEQPATILKPLPQPPSTDRDKMVACQGFEAIVIDFFIGGEHEQMVPKTASIFELLYSHGPRAFSTELDGKVPDFTWYHLPSNNMVWAETLIRRITAEKGDISAEVYEEAKAELELSQHIAGRVSQVSGTSLPTLRSHSRRVPGRSSLSLDDNDDGIVSFMPFLHYETYRGYRNMADTIDGAKSRKRSHIRRTGPPMFSSLNPPPKVSRGAPGVPSIRPSSGSPTLTSSGSSIPQRTFSSKALHVFRSLKWKLRKWPFGRNPNVTDGSTTASSDLERQPDQESHGENNTADDMHGQPAGGNVESENKQPLRDGEAQMPPANATLPAAQARSQGRGSNDTFKRANSPVNFGGINSQARQEHAGERQDQRIDEERNFEAESNSYNGSTGETNADQRSFRSQHAPQIPPSRRVEKEKILPPTRNLNEHLIRGYYEPGLLTYQPRRTLDQYAYAEINTSSHRENEQVVYRYTKDSHLTDTKIFMVDQLWLWVLDKNTIVTCSPLRWDAWTLAPRGIRLRAPHMQAPKPTFLKWLGGRGGNTSQKPHPKMNSLMLTYGGQSTRRKTRNEQQSNRRQVYSPEADAWPEVNQDDPLSIPQRVTRYLFRQSRGAIGSVHDLAGLITTCCVDVFDPYQIPDEFLFLDFFERSIGRVNDKIASHLRAFKEALSELKDGQREHEVMDITDETGLMIEVEDILDELHTLKMVLKDQEGVITDMNRILEGFTVESRKSPRVETRTLENHLIRIERMEDAAKKADTSLHRLMDLKQKQASLTEAWYARESARDTARQGKTVIVFTVVTIIFLPVSFISSVFSINTNGYPFDADDKIPFDYVMKCIMTIGLGLSVPLIIIAFKVDRIAETIYKLRRFDEKLWEKATIAAIILGITAAILTPIWTSGLSTSTKVAITVTLLVLALGVAFAIGVWYLINVAQKAVGPHSVTSTNSSR